MVQNGGGGAGGGRTTLPEGPLVEVDLETRIYQPCILAHIPEGITVHGGGGGMVVVLIVQTIYATGGIN